MSIDFSKYPLPKRFRHHTSPNLYFPAKELKIITKSYPPLIDDIDWKQVFLNGRSPDILDVGCGKGAFLFEMALDYPDKNILGIEVRKQPVEWIKTVIEGEKLENCGILWYSVVNGMQFIDDNSVEKIFYLFPDPWTKKKLKRRRAFNEDFIKEVSRVLKPRGELLLASDVGEVYEDQKEILEALNLLECTDIVEEKDWPYPLTNKEKFCIKENIKTYKMVCKAK